MAKTEISAFGNFTGTNTQGYVIVGGSNGVEGGKKLLSDIVPVVPEQVQADWEQDDTTQKDYIKNKPDVSNKIESISINNTKLEPDENKNVNIEFSGRWFGTDGDNIYISPSYGGGTGGLKCDSDYDLSVYVDKSTIDIDKTDDGKLYVIYDNDTIVENGRRTRSSQSCS